MVVVVVLMLMLLLLSLLLLLAVVLLVVVVLDGIVDVVHACLYRVLFYEVYSFRVCTPRRDDSRTGKQNVRHPPPIYLSYPLPLVCLSVQTAPPQRYNRSVGSALWNAVTSARNQLSGVKLTSGSGSGSGSGKNGGGGGKNSGSQANREKDAAADDRKLRAVHGERAGEERGGEGGRERPAGARGGLRVARLRAGEKNQVLAFLRGGGRRAACILREESGHDLGNKPPEVFQ